MPAPRTPRSPRRGAPTAALFVRVPTEQAQRLERAAVALGRPKQALVTSLLERYVDPDSPSSLADLAVHDDRRRVTIEDIGPAGLSVGHASFRPREPDVLTLEEAAALLAVEPDVLLGLAAEGGLPGRRLGEEWRFSRSGLLAWLAAPDSPPAPDPEPGTGER